MKSTPEEYTKKRLTKLRDSFKNEDGAIDLASIMVGVIVVGLIGGVIAATVFAVIPWAQDNAAKQQLDSVVSAENAYMGLSSASPSPLPAGYTANSYADSPGLAAANLLTTGSKYCAVSIDGGKGFQAFAYSSSGKIWSVSNSNTKPTESNPTLLPPACAGIAPTLPPPPPPTRPDDVTATGITIVKNNGYPTYWTDKTVTAWTGNNSATFGFSTSQVSTTTAAANYTVTFTGGENIGAAAYTAAPNILTGNGVMWAATIRPVTGGFTEGTGYITATITDKTTGAFSKKSWVVTVTPPTGPTQGSFYSDQWLDKSAPNMVSRASATFGFQISGAVPSDYTVTFSGGENIGAVIGTIGTNGPAYGAEMGGTNWYTTVSAPSGGFNNGTGVITATVKYNPTGATWTKNYNLTVVPSPGPVQGGYYASYWNNKTATVASTGSNVFGFAIKSAVASDFTVTFTSTGNVNENISATQFTNAEAADWYAIVSAKAGGYTAGTSTITATVTSRTTGQVFVKTYTLTVS